MFPGGAWGLRADLRPRVDRVRAAYYRRGERFACIRARSTFDSDGTLARFRGSKPLAIPLRREGPDDGRQVSTTHRFQLAETPIDHCVQRNGRGRVQDHGDDIRRNAYAARRHARASERRYAEPRRRHAKSALTTGRPAGRGEQPVRRRVGRVWWTEQPVG